MPSMSHPKTGAGPVRLYHGGVPMLRPGDLIRPGDSRPVLPGCPWCQARESGRPGPLGIDPPSRPGRVYATTNRLYAAHYASLYGRGDLYRVEPDGPLTRVERSDEDSIESYTAPAFRIAAVLDRAVLLTDTERRRLWREWSAADGVREHAHA